MFSHSFLLSTLLLCVTMLHSTKGAALNLDHRIVGGEPVDISQVPYQVSVRVVDSHICGGSIVGDRYILTAAHCVDGQVYGTLRVQVGSSSISFSIISLITNPTKTVIDSFVHPKYDASTNDYDVAILKLLWPLHYGATVAPVVLATSSDVYKDGDLATVTGWGVTSESGSSSQQLRIVNLNLVNSTKCQEDYGPDNTITPRMVCAAAPGKDSCQGDSGGPLTSKGKQIGVVSWGVGCARPEYPGVYSYVGNEEINQWIQQTIQ